MLASQAHISVHPTSLIEYLKELYGKSEGVQKKLKAFAVVASSSLWDMSQLDRLGHKNQQGVFVTTFSNCSQLERSTLNNRPCSVTFISKQLFESSMRPIVMQSAMEMDLDMQKYFKYFIGVTHEKKFYTTYINIPYDAIEMFGAYGAPPINPDRYPIVTEAFSYVRLTILSSIPKLLRSSNIN